MKNSIFFRIKRTIRDEGFGKFVFKLFDNCVRVICIPINNALLGVFRLLPIKNYIMLESQGDYTDNIKVFYDYLISEGVNNQYKIIWVVHEPNLYSAPKNVVFISRYKKINILSNYYAAVSKIFIFSHPYWLKYWRTEQIVINTSHSVAQLKKANPPKNKAFDYVLCCSDYCSTVKQQAFAISEEHTLLLGMPRIDIMYTHVDAIKKLYPDAEGKRLVLSMETFKQSKAWNDSEAKDCFAINVVHSIEELRELDAFLDINNTLLVVKIHHLQDLSFLRMVSLKNIRYLTDDTLREKKLLVNQLLENADVLLTDYSSVFYEFLLVDRPIGFLIGDYTEYSRGFITDDPLNEMPGTKIEDISQLESFLCECTSGIDLFRAERRMARNKVFKYNDSDNCKRLWNWIKEKFDGGKML